MHLLAMYLLFLPLYSSVDPTAAADAAVIDYVTDDPSFLSEQPSKQTPLEHSDITHFFPSHACIRTATAFCMILL